MISLTRVKELMGDKQLPDREAEAVRDACYAWAELALEARRRRRRDASGRVSGNENSAPERA